MNDFVSKVMEAGLKSQDALKVYNYIKKDTMNIKAIYSADINESLAAIGRMEAISRKNFKNADIVQLFFINNENIVMPIIKDLGL